MPFSIIKPKIAEAPCIPEDKILERMKALMKLTDQDGLEHGFSVKDSELKECTGTSCSVKLDTRNVTMDFHTHPSDIEERLRGFSPGDMIIAIRDQIPKFCIGYRLPDGKHQVKCTTETPKFFVPDWLNNVEIVDILSMNANHLKGTSEYERAVQRFREAADRFEGPFRPCTQTLLE